MADVLEYTANAGNVFDIQNRIIQNQERMGGAFVRSSGHAEGSFLRSDRAVGRASANLVGNLLQVNSAADAVAVSLQSFERATHFGLGIGIGLAVATKAYEILHKQIEATDAAEKALEKSLATPKSVALGLSNSGLEKESETLQKQIEEANKQENSPTQTAADVLKYGPKFWTDLTGGESVASVDQERADRILKVQERLRDVQEQIGKNAQLEADYGDQSVYSTERDVELKKAQLVAEQKIAALRAGLADGSNAGLQRNINAINQVEQQKEDKINLKGDLAEISQSEEAEKSAVKGTREQRAAAELLITYKAHAKELERINALHGTSVEKLKAETQLAKDMRSLIDNLGDRLSETPQQTAARQAAEREQERRTALAEAQINDARDREKRGAQLDENNPVTQALRAIEAGEKAKKGEGDFSSIASLAGQDYTGMLSLANHDFAGLASLAALQLKVI